MEYACVQLGSNRAKVHARSSSKSASVTKDFEGRPRASFAAVKRFDHVSSDAETETVDSEAPSGASRQGAAEA